MAKLTYSKEETVRPAEMALEVHCRGINVRMPEGETNTITFYFQSMDSDGNVVDSRPFTAPIPAALQDRIDALVQHALDRATDAGYPAGGVVG